MSSRRCGRMPEHGADGSMDRVPAEVRVLDWPLATIPAEKFLDELAEPVGRLGSDIDGFDEPLQIDRNKYATLRGKLGSKVL
jgi:hypothetical protein